MLINQLRGKVILEKQTVPPHLLKKFTDRKKNPNFIAIFTTAVHQFLASTF
jgi:hypothetical protein